MKILRVTSAFVPPWRGLGPGPYELTWAQVEAGHQVTVITRHTQGCEELDKSIPFRVVRLRCANNLTFSLLAAIKIIFLHYRERYDVVHNHGSSAVCFILIRALFLLRVPVVTSVHIVRKAQYDTIRRSDPYRAVKAVLGEEVVGSFFPARPSKRDMLFEKIFLSLSDGLAVVSPALKNEIETEYGISGGIFSVLNGANTERFGRSCKESRDDLLTRHGIRGCRFLILFVGVLNGRKGEFDLIAALEKIVADRPDAHLLIIGDGPTKKLAKEMAEKLKIDSNIHFVTNVAYDEMAYYYKASDLFVLPSYSEGLPKVLLEAISCGIPVIASDIPCHKDLIADSARASLFKTSDVESLSSVIFAAIKGNDGEKMAQDKLIELVRIQYNWNSVVKRLDNVYSEVMSTHHP